MHTFADRSGGELVHGIHLFILMMQASVPSDQAALFFVNESSSSNLNVVLTVQIAK